MIKRCWNYISGIGISSSLAHDELKKVLFLNRISFIISLFIITSILINIFLHSSFFIPVLSACLALILLNYYFNKKQLFLVSKINLMLSVTILLSFMSFNGASGSAIEFYFLSLLVLPVILFHEKYLIYIFQWLSILCLIAQHFFVEHRQVPLEGKIILDVFYVVNSIYSGLLIILAIMFFRNINIRVEKELIQKNKEIKDKNLELETSNKDLDAFTYSVAHDLQAPLRAIYGFSQIIEKDYTEKIDEEGKSMLDLIRKNILKMRKLIEDLLTLSRSGKKELELTKVNMNELIQDILTENGNNNFGVIVNPLPDISADIILIKQVWVNLISNAVKYATKDKNKNPRIEIGAEPKENGILFYIRDNGIGFDMKFATRIFDPFQRLHTDKDYQGSGVGLAIVQSIIKKHGGKIWVESKVNEGTTFYFILPT